MKDKNKRQAIILCIVGILTLITLVVGATFAYFKAQGGAGGSSDVNVITATTDLLTFKIDKAINIGISQSELKKGGTDVSDSTSAHATLTASNSKNVEKTARRYNIYFVIDTNDFEYTTQNGTPELYLNVTDPNGNKVENITGLVHYEKGFDITTRTGGFLLVPDYDIEATRGNTITQDWKVEVTFANLDTDQSKNMGKSLSGKLYVTKDKMSSYELTRITNMLTQTTYNSISTVLNIEEGSAAAEKYYYAAEKTNKTIGYVSNKYYSKRLSNVRDLKFVESSEGNYKFTNLDEKSTYKIYSYLVDKNGIKSNLYETEVTTDEYVVPKIIGLNHTETLNSIKLDVTAEGGTNEVAKYYYSKDNGATYEESTSNSYTFDNLNDTTEYKIKIKVEDTLGRISTEYTKAITTTAYILPSVTKVDSLATYKTIKLTVDALGGSYNVNKYYYSINDSEFKEGQNTYTFDNLTEKTTYKIKVKVNDTQNRVSNIYETEVTTSEYKIPVVENVTTSSKDTSITISVNAKNGDGTVNKYYYSKDNGSNYVESTSSNYTFTGLTANTTFYLKVKVKDDNNRISSEYAKTAKTDFAKPVINNVVVSDNKPTEVQITTNAVAGSNAITNYYYSINNGSYTSSTSNKYTFTGLTGNTTYTIRVYAVDSVNYKSDVFTYNVTTYKNANDIILANKSFGYRGSLSDAYSVTTTNTLFKTNDSEGTSYYYAGNPTDNYVYFAGYYWRIVRVNGDGSIRLIYNGTSTAKSSANSTIGTGAWNTNKTITDDNAGIGYMYGTAGKWSDLGRAGNTWNATLDTSETYKYSTSYTFDPVTGYYTLAGSVYTGTYGYSMVGRYTCFENTTSCRWLRYVNSYVSSTKASITGFDKGDYGNITSTSVTHANNNNSAVKTQLDSWYQTNIENKGYSKYIDTNAGFCNDRTPSSSRETIDYKGGYGKFETYYAPQVRNSENNEVLTCSQTNDYFTPTTSSYGNKKLTKSIGMITLDEIIYAGENGSYLFNTEDDTYYWTMSPANFKRYSSFTGYMYCFGNGILYAATGVSTINIRPVINISKNVKLSGLGTISNPYTIS